MSVERGVALATLLDALPARPVVTGETNRVIVAIETDSRAVRNGALFVGMRGLHADGHWYVREAVANGAAAVMVERLPECELPAGVTVVRVPQTPQALSTIAATFYGNPSHAVDVIGITGTNGKTTTAHMVGAILTGAGLPCGVVGTVGGTLGTHKWPVHHTTPLPPELHRLLAEMRDQGAAAVALEVSSHALALNRVDDVRFSVAALTNIGRDHLDFHETIEQYAGVKRRLLSLAPLCVVNADDRYGARWAFELRAERRRVISYGLRPGANLVADHVVSDASRSRFRLAGRGYEVALPGRFNVLNALAAIGIAQGIGIDDAAIAGGLRSVQRVAGRMERFTADGVAVVIDYAHTPDALESALGALRESTSGALRIVFGCGGDRDRAKRPEMGAVAARFADHLYVTSDNPRSEEPQAIVDAILRGVGDREHVVELDRRRAIERAIGDAASGDVVLIAGKGHESHQLIGDRVLPFDDRAVARAALAMRGVLR